MKGSMYVLKDVENGNIRKSTWFVRMNASATMDTSPLPTIFDVLSRCPYFEEFWCCVLLMLQFCVWYLQIAHIVESCMQQTVLP